MQNKIDKQFSDPSYRKRTSDPVNQNSNDYNDEDFVVPEPRPKKIRNSGSVPSKALESPPKATLNSALLPSNKTHIYKQKPGKDFWWVPKESYLRDQISNFTAKLYALNFSIEPYCGQKDSEDPKRQAMHIQLENEFKTVAQKNVPAMKNGHAKDDNTIHRALVIKKSQELAGAIYFTINMDTRECQIRGIEVKEAYRKNKLGYYLLHTAILTALFYGSLQIETSSNQNVKGFFEKNGFISQLDENENASSKNEGDSVEYTLNLLVPGSCEKFLNCVKSWTSERYLKSLIKMFSNNAKSLSPETKLPTTHQPKPSEFPLTAFLASYLFRNQKKEMDAKEIEAIKAQRAANAVPKPEIVEPVNNGDMNNWWDCLNL